jgi:hypothetical protein
MTDDDGLSVRRSYRLVRQRRHNARGDSAAPPCTGHARQHRLSA